MENLHMAALLIYNRYQLYIIPASICGYVVHFSPNVELLQGVAELNTRLALSKLLVALNVVPKDQSDHHELIVLLLERFSISRSNESLGLSSVGEKVRVKVRSKLLGKIGGHHCCKNLQAFSSLRLLEGFLELHCSHRDGFGGKDLHPCQRLLVESFLGNKCLEISLRVPAGSELENWSLRLHDESSSCVVYPFDIVCEELLVGSSQLLEEVLNRSLVDLYNLYSNHVRLVHLIIQIYLIDLNTYRLGYGRC